MALESAQMGDRSGSDKSQKTAANVLTAALTAGKDSAPPASTGKCAPPLLEEKSAADELHDALDASLLAFGTNMPKPVSRIVSDYCRGLSVADLNPLDWTVTLTTTIIVLLALLVSRWQAIVGRRRDAGGPRL